MHKTAPLLINGESCNIDVELIPIIDFCNSIGFKTQFCCIGDTDHPAHIIFSEDVDDDMIACLLKISANKQTHSGLVGQFMRWDRIVDSKLASNWMYEARHLNWLLDDWERIKADWEQNIQ